MHPRERVGLACQRWGDAEVLRRVGETLRSLDRPVSGDARELALFLGQRQHDPTWLDGGKPPGHAYWARVWSARALLYLWHDDLGPDVTRALRDEHWRVREMALKVVVVREIGCADVLGPLVSDDVPRMRASTARALGVVGEAEHAVWLRELADDGDPAVARAADRALAQLSRRVDRDLSHP